jgi:hypothetical protein
MNKIYINAAGCIVLFPTTETGLIEFNMGEITKNELTEKSNNEIQ